MPQPPGVGHLDESWPRYVVGKAVRHLRWARTEGLARLVEEDRLNPRERVATAWHKARWRRANPMPPGSARPVYVVGLQRSGTNMLLRGVDQAPEVEVRNESDREVFFRYRLRSEDTLVRAVRRSRHAIVLVKPLCESHEVDRLLELPGVRHGRAVWVYRDYVSRARSEVSKFGDSNLRALQVIAQGNAETIWQGRRLPAESVALVRSFDVDAMTPLEAAVLFWVVRNRLFFDLGLDRRGDVMALSYNDFVASPELQMRRLCGFIGLPYRDALCAHVEARQSHGLVPLELDPRLVDLADDLGEKLADAAARPAGGPGGGDQSVTTQGLA